MSAPSNPPSAVSTPPSPLAYLTPDLPGIGGLLKVRPDDFLVDEQPLYEPAGSGEHLYLFIEKRERTTADVVQRLAKAFGVRRSDVGFAGLKDRQAVTRQHFSVYLPKRDVDPDAAARVDAPPHVKVLWVDRHANKLRRGHLAGNRFVIRVRGVDPTSVLRAKRVLDTLAAQGAPNYFGAQRFGVRGDNAELGRLLVLGEWERFLAVMLGAPREGDPPASMAARGAYDRGDHAAALDAWPRHQRPERHVLALLQQGRSPEAAVRGLDPLYRGFLVSAFQSDVFNRILDRRLRDGLFDRLVPGDLAWKHDSRAVFAVDEATAAAENEPGGRVSRHEVSPSGPMWGAGMTRAAGDVADWERSALQAAGVTEDRLGSDVARAEGARRQMRVPLTAPDVSGGVDEHGGYVRLAFELGRGSFATVILREIMKSDAATQAVEGDEP